jgi:hypothetical protein
MEIREVICRYTYFENEKVNVESKSRIMDYKSEYMCEWGNTLYLHFKKDDYPFLNYPVNGNYYHSDLAELPFHGGITFYQERTIDNVVHIKAGCDYQHLYDELDYGIQDNGIRILKESANRLVEHLVELHNKRKQEYESRLNNEHNN